MKRIYNVGHIISCSCLINYYTRRIYFMPTNVKLEKVLASAKGLAAELKTFSMDTNDQQSKEMFHMLSTDADNIASTLQDRVNFVKSEEPQYDELP